MHLPRPAKGMRPVNSLGRSPRGQVIAGVRRTNRAFLPRVLIDQLRVHFQV